MVNKGKHVQGPVLPKTTGPPSTAHTTHTHTERERLGLQVGPYSGIAKPATAPCIGCHDAVTATGAKPGTRKTAAGGQACQGLGHL